MPNLNDFYYNNPLSIIDRNKWDDRLSMVETNFLSSPLIYTPLVKWVDRSSKTGAETSRYTDLLVSDPNVDPIGMSDLYVEEAIGIDSRERRMTINRYASKVMYQEGSSDLNRWLLSPEGSRDWSGVLRGVLGQNIIEVIELITRNGFLSGPKSFWTYGGSATDFSGLNASSKFDLGIVNEWNFRLGQTGTPIIPGDRAGAKVAILPPGATYDFQTSLVGGTGEEKFWTDYQLYAGQALRAEVGKWREVRFLTVPNNAYGMNSAVLYNAGSIAIQSEVSSPISRQDGSPDPETTMVDGVFRVGQKNAVHYVQLAAGSFVEGDFNVHDIVSIHKQRTNDYGVTDGVDFLAGTTVVRRVVEVDVANQRLAFDRPIMRDFTQEISTGVYAYVTKATHVGMCLVLGSGSGVRGNINKPVTLYNPKPVDDFESVWRFVWDMKGGLNVWEPHTFSVHFVAVSVPTPNGVIEPPAA